MEIQNEFCEIKIIQDNQYTVDSADNKHYDIIYNLNNYQHDDFYKTLILNVDLYTHEYSIALVGNYYSSDADCAVLAEYILTVLQNEDITQIDIRDSTVILHKHFDCFGCNYGIYKVNTGYIIYGEIEILMLDDKFNQVWKFSGKDIFVSVSGKKSFVLGDNSIQLYDFEDNFYEIGYDGNLLDDNTKGKTET